MPARFKIHFAQLVLEKAARDGGRILQKDIADATGLSLPTIGRWLGGDIDRLEPDAMDKLMTYLQCSMTDLVSIEHVAEDPTQPPKGKRGRPPKVKADE